MEKTSLILIFIVAINISCNSKFDKYANQYNENVMSYNSFVFYFEENCKTLINSKCTNKFEQTIIYNSEIAQENCCPEEKDTLTSILSRNLFEKVEIVSCDCFDFHLEFIPSRFELLGNEQNIHLVYIGNDTLPDFYKPNQSRIKHLDKNWWLVEFTESAF